jgi:DNA-directed RNA polymerase subunit RPC12/RpoP
MTRSQIIRYFTDSSVALLAATSAALSICNIANANLIQPHDPLFAISMDTFFWILGTGAIAVMLVCIFVHQPRFKLALILWFATNLVIYRLGLQWQHAHNTRGYVSTLAHTFNLSSNVTASLLTFLFLYLLTASAALLIWNFLAGPEEVSLKAICAYCGGHIAFSPQNFGQKIPCPHCQTTITLRKPENLKMSCFFCQEHIEFPAHAIGKKLKCPHCNMDITLKEPA